MKKILLSVFTAALIVLLCVFAFRENDLRIEISSENAKAGEAVTLNVSLKGNPGIAAASGMISFDHNALRLISIEGLAKGTWSAETANEDGMFLWADTNELHDNCVLMKLHFEVLENAAEGGYPVEIHMDPTWDGVFNLAEKEVSAKAFPGKVYISAKG